MTEYLSAENFPNSSEENKNVLTVALETVLTEDFTGDMFMLMGTYQQIMSDNSKRSQWPEIHEKMRILFMAGKAMPMDGPMVGSTVSIRDSDYFKETAQHFGEERSIVANIEWMATAWNMTFANTGLWMGKTFETVSKEVVDHCVNENSQALKSYDPQTTRIGRNYFREPPEPNLIQNLGLPALTQLWKLKQRPSLDNPEIFDTRLTPTNAQKEKQVPYSMTGGLFLANMGQSVVLGMNGKAVYQLNYRWPGLNPVYPMTRLVDEVVQIDEGIYLGQLVFATKHYALATFDSDGTARQLGEDYNPHGSSPIAAFLARLFRRDLPIIDYGYQNNGFFLMMDPDYSERIFATEAFHPIRPRLGEAGYQELDPDS